MLITTMMTGIGFVHIVTPLFLKTMVKTWYVHHATKNLQRRKLPC